MSHEKNVNDKTFKISKYMWHKQQISLEIWKETKLENKSKVGLYHWIHWLWAFEKADWKVLCVWGNTNVKVSVKSCKNQWSQTFSAEIKLMPLSKCAVYTAQNFARQKLLPYEKQYQIRNNLCDMYLNCVHERDCVFYSQVCIFVMYA